MTEAVQSEAFVGKAYIAVGNGASPEVFTRYCEVDDIGGIGTKNDQVEVTTFCSGGDKEYVPGLGDGNEISLSANYSLDNDTQEQLIGNVEDKDTINMQLQMGDDSPIARTFQFRVAMLSWEIDPSVSKQNVIKFTGKITGGITRTETGG
jgi:hypothetical protein